MTTRSLKRLAGCVAASVLAVMALDGGSSQASDASQSPTVAVVGDSFTAGWTGTTRNQADAWWNYTASDLGWKAANVVADPGGGYWTWGDYGTIYQALAAHPIASSTNYVLLQAGLNDSNSSAPDVVRSVNDVINLAKAQAPNATVIVIGMLVPGQQGMSAARLNIARRLGDYDAIHDTRYMIGAMCSFEVGPDGTHPTALGHRQIGDWVAWHISNGLDNGTPLHRDPTGSFYTV